jgi:hypothetical protein
VTIRAYKLFRQHKDGSISPLFINRRLRVPLGEWLPAEDHPTPGYAHRSGWHVTSRAHAPHLSKHRRRWYIVEIEQFERIVRPKSQGGVWYLAQRMRVVAPARETNRAPRSP